MKQLLRNTAAFAAIFALVNLAVSHLIFKENIDLLRLSVQTLLTTAIYTWLFSKRYKQ